MGSSLEDEFLMQEGLLYTKPKYGSVFVFQEPAGGIADRAGVSVFSFQYYILFNPICPPGGFHHEAGFFTH